MSDVDNFETEIHSSRVWTGSIFSGSYNTYCFGKFLLFFFVKMWVVTFIRPVCKIERIVLSVFVAL